MSGTARVAMFAVEVMAATWTTAAASEECLWLPGQGLLGTNGTVYAALTWDPDGPGPQPELLVVGGAFGVAGDVFAANIAAWDGSTWQPLGAGTNNVVRALAVHNGELIAGGDFTTAGGTTCTRIARWDGSTWTPLASGFSGAVRTLTTHNGELIAGGSFSRPASSVAGMAAPGRICNLRLTPRCAP